MKNPIELLPPGGNRIFVVLRMEDSRDRVPFTLLNDLPLDLGHSSVIEASVNELFGGRIARPTHVVSFPMAPSTDWLSSSGRLPFNPRSSA